MKVEKVSISNENVSIQIKSGTHCRRRKRYLVTAERYTLEEKDIKEKRYPLAVRKGAFNNYKDG